jgi:hypothetical protein
MTDRDVIERVASLFGTTVWEGKPYAPPSKLPYFKATATGTRAAILMRAIIPYIGKRRGDRIREILAEWKAKPSTRSMRIASCKRSYAERRASKPLADFARA